MFLEPLEPRQMMNATPIQDPDPVGGFAGNYYPPQHSQFSSTSFLSSPATGDALTVALNYFAQNQATFGLTAADMAHYTLTNRYSDTDGGITHLYLQQSYNGLPVADAVASANVMPNGQMLTVAANFVSGLSYPTLNTPLIPAISSQQAVADFASAAGISFDGVLTVVTPPSGRSQKIVVSDGSISLDPIPVQLQYVPAPGGGVDLAWEMTVSTTDGEHLYNLAVAASGSRTGQVIRLADWQHNASYNVFPQSPTSVQDPVFGNRLVVFDPQDPVASPFGWHDTNGAPGPEFFDTRGNNVVLQEDINGDDLAGTRPVDLTQTLTFTAPFDPQQTPAFNQESGEINAFYWTNLAHDVTARHGFNEAAGNMQSLNYSGLGFGFDPLIVDTRDPFGGITTGAGPNIQITPDGASPRMSLGDNTIDIFSPNFNPITPARDSSFDATIISHEYFHAVTNRLVGGPSNVSATQALQSAGMDEGWSDWFALVMTANGSDNQNTIRTTGNWYLGQQNPGSGVREYPYSFDMSIDPHTLGDFNLLGGNNLPFPFSNGGNEPHNAGEIWASTLWDMTWLLINKYGYDTDIKTGIGGRSHALDLVLAAQKITPANPTFLEARNAIISADFALNQGDNYELIWHAFARRGMGVSSVVGPTANQPNVFESFDEPPPLGHVFGTVFNDDNANARRDAAEVPLAGWTVYLDQNDNGKFESFETSFVTDATGSYHFNFSSSTNAIIRQVVMPNWTQTLPTNGAARRVFVPRGTTITGQDFGDHGLPGKISGLIWNDIDQDLVRDTNEPGIEGLVVYVDYNNDGKVNLLEPSAQTDHNGRFTILNIRPGDWTVRVSTQPGITPFSPLTVHVDSNATTPNINFPNGTTPIITLNQDYGDAPDTYGTTLAANGARHGLLPGFELGATVSADTNGQPSAGANLDSSDDGVVFGAGGPTPIITPGATADLTVTVTTSGFLPGKLQAWIDYNHDGDFFDPGEQAVTNLVLGAGVHHVFVPVPANVATGTTYARFRYGYESNLGPTGPSTAGEVEDYQVTVLANVPIAKDDDLTALLLKPGVTTALNVLANDSGTTFGPPKIFSVDSSTLPAGTIVTINAAQDTIFITPGPTAFGPYSFTYKVTDNSGRPPAQSVSSPGTVKINVTLSDPKAVDDFVPITFTAVPQQVNIPVLANDLLPAPNAAAFQVVQNSVQLITQNAPPGAAGAMLIAPGGKSLNFTAPAGFHGTLVYQYTINEVPDDPTTAPSTGRVTVQIADVVGGVPQPDLTQQLAQLNVDLLDSSKLTLNANSLLHPGDFFYVRVRSQDLRAGGDATNRGVQAAYLDLLFDPAVAKPVLSPEHPLGMNIVFDGGPQEATTAVQAGPTPTATVFAGDPAQLDPADGFYLNHTLTFTSGALNGQSGWIIGYSAATGTFTFASNTFTSAPAVGDTFRINKPLYDLSRRGAAGTPGLVDEVGASVSGSPPGPGTFTVFTLLMQVQPGTAGQNLRVLGDPADNDPDTRVSEPADPGPGNLILTDEQVFLRPSPTIPIVQAGGGEFSNSLNRLDVSNDGFVAPDDALLVINELNTNGTRALSMANMSSVGFAPPSTFPDVDYDSSVTPTDALLIINYLNSLPQKKSGAQGEGEGDAGMGSADPAALIADDGAARAAADNAVADMSDDSDLLTTQVITTMSAGNQTPAISPSLLALTPHFASSYRAGGALDPASQRLFQGTSVNPDAADELFGGLGDEES